MRVMPGVLCALLLVPPLAAGAQATPPQGVAQAPKPKPAPAPPPFDENANPRDTIAKAMSVAKSENKRVLVHWGSNADLLSTTFAELCKKDRELASKVLYEYEVALVDVGRLSKNLDLAATYQADPKAGGIPYVTLLDADGKVLANEAMTRFKSSAAGGPPFDIKSVVEFLTTHQAEYLQAASLFDAAKVRAKREDKLIFLRFSAPW